MPWQPRAPAPDRRASMVMIIVFFIIGLSVILSFDWSTGTFSPDAPTQIFFAVLVAAIIYIAAQYAMAHRGLGPMNARLCPACGRRIPGDALLCPYCGQRLS